MIRRTPGQFWCPLIFVCTGLIAISVLGMQDSSMPLAIGLALFFIAPYLINVRIPDALIPIWISRLFVYLIIYFATRSNDGSTGDAADPHFVFVLGELCAAEMVLQCWRRTPTGRPPGIALILFAGIAYMGASYISDATVIPWLTPAFFALLILSWRRIEAQTLHDPMSGWARFIYLTGIAAAIAAGWGSYATINQNHDKLTSLFLNVSPQDVGSGMSSQPQLRSSFGLQGSTQRVLVLSTEPDDPHLRAMSFDIYDAGSWSPSSNSRTFVPLLQSPRSFSSTTKKIVVTKKAYASGLLYEPLESSLVTATDDPSADWAPSSGGPIRSQHLPPSTYTFIESNSSSDLFDHQTSSRQLAQDLILPGEIDPRVIALSKSLVQGKQTSLDKINALCTKLDEDHSYSLSYSQRVGDPVSQFILSKKPSFCVYFASAAVIMMRAVGIPARYVIGYYAHEHESGMVVVRQRDAHAWAEAYYDGKWHTVDATPADGRPDEIFGSVSTWQRWSEAAQDYLQYLQQIVARVGPIKIAGAVAVVVGLYFIVVETIRWFLARRKTARTGGNLKRELSEPAARFERLLRQNSLEIREGETWSELLSRSEYLTLDRAIARRFVDEYNSVRFGNVANDDLMKILDELESGPKMEISR